MLLNWHLTSAISGYVNILATNESDMYELGVIYRSCIWSPSTFLDLLYIKFEYIEVLYQNLLDFHFAGQYKIQYPK